jgi:hypothetical protein
MVLISMAIIRLKVHKSPQNKLHTKGVFESIVRINHATVCAWRASRVSRVCACESVSLLVERVCAFKLVSLLGFDLVQV